MDFITFNNLSASFLFVCTFACWIKSSISKYNQSNVKDKNRFSDFFALTVQSTFELWPLVTESDLWRSVEPRRWETNGKTDALDRVWLKDPFDKMMKTGGGGGGTQIWFRRGCAAEAAKPVPIFKGHFGGKGYPLLRVFSQENCVFVYFSDEKGENI